MSNCRMILRSTDGAGSVVFTYTVSGVSPCSSLAFNGTYINLSDGTDATYDDIPPVRVLDREIELGKVETTGKPVSIDEVISHMEKALTVED